MITEQRIRQEHRIKHIDYLQDRVSRRKHRTNEIIESKIFSIMNPQVLKMMLDRPLTCN